MLTSNSFYVGRDGLLYHLDSDQKLSDRHSFSQLVVPPPMRFEVLSNVHDHVSGAHFGFLLIRLSKDIGGKVCLKMLSIGVSLVRIAQ